MARKSGKRGAIYAEVSTHLVTTTRITEPADCKTYDSGTDFWVRSTEPTIRPDGVISGCSVSVTSGQNNKVTIGAGSVYIGGTEYAVAETTVTCSRGSDAAAPYITNAIYVDTDGACSVAAGIEGTAVSSSYATNGGHPYIPDYGTDSGAVLLGHVRFTDDADAEVDTSEIYTGVAEFTGDNSYTVDYVDGIIDFVAAYSKIHASSAWGSPTTYARGIYATWVYGVFQKVGDLFNWSIDVSDDRVDVTAFDDDWTRAVAGTKSWSGSASGYWVNTTWWDAAIGDVPKLLKLYPDGNVTTEYFSGMAFIDWSLTTPREGAIAEEITFTGDGSLSRKTS